MKFWRSRTLFFSLATLLTATAIAQTNPAAGQLDPATAARLQQQNETLKTNPTAIGNVDAETQKKLLEQGKVPPRSILRQSTIDAAQRDPLSAVTDGENPIAKELAHITTVVFISESIPAHTLAPIMQAGLKRNDVLYLLRGWKGDGAQLKPLVKRLRDKAGLKDTGPQVNLYVLPKAFRMYDIKHVPAYVIKTKNSGWRGLSGNVSLNTATEEVEAGRWGKTIGNTWPIAEPDKAKEYEDRLRNIKPEELAKQRDQMRQDAETTIAKGYPLPKAKFASNRLFDPSVALPSDIVVEGKAIARKGQRVNALSADPNGRRYFAAIDATDQWQLEMAKQWAVKYPNLMLFYTQRDNRLNDLQTPAYPAVKDPLNRLGITEVPSLSSQEGLNLRVQTFVK